MTPNDTTIGGENPAKSKNNPFVHPDVIKKMLQLGVIDRPHAVRCPPLKGEWTKWTKWTNPKPATQKDSNE